MAGHSLGWLHSLAQYGRPARSILIFQQQAASAIVFVLASLAAFIFVRGNLRKLAIVFGEFALVGLWWLTLEPSNDRAWQPDVAQTAWAEMKGDEVTVHNMRNCEYRSETDFTAHWETRTGRLSQITGMDQDPDFSRLIREDLPNGN